MIVPSTLQGIIMKRFLSALVLLACTQSFASAPFSTLANPGSYHHKLGDFQITTISDGSLAQEPYKLMVNIKPGKIKEMLHKHFLPDTIEGSINTFLINTGSKLVLVDTGSGKSMGENAGHMLTNLKLAGYSPEQIDAVVITHWHPDHVGGLATEGKINFPKATLFIDKRDVDFSTNPKIKEKHPDQFKPFFDVAVMNITAYQKEQKINAFIGTTEIVPGVTAHECSGHTPGHTCYEVKSGDERLELIGDSLHIASVQFETPTAGMVYDNDPKAATKHRENMLKSASASRVWIGGAHLSFPGLGHVRKEKSGFAFVPANFIHK